MSRSFLAVLTAATTACAAPNQPPPAATPDPAAVPSTARSAEPAEAPRPAAPKFVYSQCHVDGPYIAMTFDDGPHGANTPRLLEMLKQRKIKATFFVVGQCVAEYPEIAKRIVEEGHEIANHSWSHPQLTKLGEGGVTDQLGKTHDVVHQTTGVTMKLMRPPYGAFSQNQQAWAFRKWGYRCILWDVDPLDWKIRSAAHVKSEILGHTVPGSIILSHDIHKSTIDAMPETLDGLLAKGFKFVTVSELIAMDRPVPPKPKATPAPKPAPEVSHTPAPAAEAVPAKPPAKGSSQ
jgi:peptidoglycan/xylan/chitin deacetylase (PgdA/CDA1 family)